MATSIAQAGMFPITFEEAMGILAGERKYRSLGLFTQVQLDMPGRIDGIQDNIPPYETGEVFETEIGDKFMLFSTPEDTVVGGLNILFPPHVHTGQVFNGHLRHIPGDAAEYVEKDPLFVTLHLKDILLNEAGDATLEFRWPLILPY